ncbi:Hsp70 family protein [Syntrophomonas erecta]
MHLGIDFGTTFTKLGYMDKQVFCNLCPHPGFIPTAAARVPAGNRWLFGEQARQLGGKETINMPFLKLAIKRNPSLKVGEFNLAKIMARYFTYLNQTYVAPVGLPDSIAVAVPNYFGMNQRHQIMQAVRQGFSVENVFLLPEPIAALAGYNFNASFPVEGDILVVDLGGGTTDFSFLTISQSRNEILLETQLQMGQDAFSGAEIDRGILRNILAAAYYIQTGQQLPSSFISEKSLSREDRYYLSHMLTIAEKAKIDLSLQGLSIINEPDFFRNTTLTLTIDKNRYIKRLRPVFNRLKEYINYTLKPQAQLLGLCTGNTWHIDHLLLLGGTAQAIGVKEFFQELFPQVPMITTAEPELNVVKGLSIWNNLDHPPLKTRTIYPFHFYAEKTDAFSGENRLEPLPFDITNLELDTRGRYRIFSFSAASEFNLSSREDQVVFRIYESEEALPVTGSKRLMGLELVAELEAPRCSLPEKIDLYLDFKNNRLELAGFSTVTEPAASPGILTGYTDRQKQAYQVLEQYGFIDNRLMQDYLVHLNNIKDNEFKTGSVKAALFKLLALYQLFTGG